MYLPEVFLESNLATLHDFIDQNSFCLLISQVDGLPFASHLPLLLDRGSGPSGTLSGHMARANPQWKQGEGNRVMAVFSGPHAYVSPSWYEAEHVVPTWNYVAVHASGHFRVVEDPDQLLEIVRDSVETYERSLPRPWSLGERDTYVDRLLQQIVGFRIEIEHIEGKWKLSQNHPVERRKKVIAALASRDDGNSTAIAEMMQAMIPEASFTDDELMLAFESQAVSPQQWNHRAHVRAAYLYVVQNALDEAIRKMRASLMKLNLIHKAPDTLKRGYHETITVAFMRLIADLIRLNGPLASSMEFCDANPTLLDKKVLHRFYSESRLWSMEAKRSFVEPDLAPLDVSVICRVE